MAKLSKIALSEERCRDGVWITFFEDIELCIRPAGNAEFRVAMQKKARRHVNAALLVDGDADVRDATIPAMARHILVGWKNLLQDDGSELSYSPKAADKLLRDPRFGSLYDFVSRVSSDEQLYRESEIQAAEGN